MDKPDDDAAWTDLSQVLGTGPSPCPDISEFMRSILSGPTIELKGTWTPIQSTCSVCAAPFGLDDLVTPVTEENSGLTVLACPKCLAALASIDRR